MDVKCVGTGGVGMNHGTYAEPAIVLHSRLKLCLCSYLAKQSPTPAVYSVLLMKPSCIIHNG